MGAKNPDRVRPAPTPEEALTLAEMHLARWTLLANCPRCGVHLRADLRMMIRMWGPDMIWWGQTPRCPAWACDGRLHYMARSTNGGTWKTMRNPPPDRLVELWRAKRGQFDRGPR